DADLAVRAGVAGGIEHLFAVIVHHGEPVGELDRGLERLGEAAVDALLHHQSVHHHAYVVLDVLVEVDVLVQSIIDAVHAHAHEPRALVGLELFDVLALPAAHDGSEDLHLRARARLHPVRDLIHRLTDDLLAALGTMGSARAGVEQTHVVVYLRHRAHRGTG